MTLLTAHEITGKARCGSKKSCWVDEIRRPRPSAPACRLTPVASYIVMTVKQSATANRELPSPNSRATAVVTACQRNTLIQHSALRSKKACTTMRFLVLCGRTGKFQGAYCCECRMRRRHSSRIDHGFHIPHSLLVPLCEDLHKPAVNYKTELSTPSAPPENLTALQHPPQVSTW